MRHLRPLPLALLAIALLVGAAYAFASESDPAPGPRAERTEPALAAVKGGLPVAAAAKTVHRCRTQSVRTRVGRSKRIRLRCVHRNRKGKVTYRKIAGGPNVSRELAVRPKHGRLRHFNQRTAKVTYKPRRRFAGRDRIGFVLRTRLHGTFRGRVAIRVVPRSQPPAPGAPACANGAATVPYDGSVQLTLVCSGDVTSLQLLSNPQDGTLGPIAGDRVTYTQTARAVRTDGFSFSASGPGGTSAPAQLTIQVTPPPAPTCEPQAVTTREDDPIEIQAVCSGVDISYGVLSPPSHGALTDIGQTTGDVVYAPSPAWFSPDDPPKPDVFQITATNPGGAAPPTPIDVTVLPNAPTCEDVDATTLVDRTDHIPLPCGNAHTEQTWEIVGQPQHGTLGTVDQTTGRVAYTPDPGYVSPGPPDAPVADTFTYKATNTGGVSGIATATVLTVPAPPTCAALDQEVDYETPIALQLDCLTDAGAEQRYELVEPLAPVEAGALDQDPGFATNGQLTYTPADGFFTDPGGSATFAFRAVNSGGVSHTIVASLQVDEPDPTCDDFYGTTPAGVALDFDVPCEELSGGADTFSITAQPPAGQGTVSVAPATGEATYTPPPGFFVPEGGARVTFTYQATALVGGATSTGVGHIDVLPPPPTCSDSSAKSFYMTPLDLTIDCTGPELAYTVLDPPEHGELSPSSGSGAVVYTPAARYAGPDGFTATASNRGGEAATPATVSLTVREWELRAVGDSVTAAFGFYGDGSPMSILDLFDCKPPGVVNDRCSSNSTDGPGYAGTVPNWTADYGLANDIAWPAQFSNSIQGGGHVTAPTMFRNQAVTGSEPADWLPGGALESYLMDVIDQEPDLLTMTMGANPLLSEILLTGAGEECAFTFTVAGLQDCIQPFIDSVQLPQRLQALYTQILQGTDHTQLVVMPYHLAIPYANLYSAWQLEVMGDMINANVATAVEATAAALPSEADRLGQILPSQSPQDTNPQHLPRFDIGTPPTVHDSWNGTYDCAWYYPDVDGPSKQSAGSQVAMALVRTPLFGPPLFCFGEPWILSTDTGIHPNQDGHARFAATLENYALANGLLPPLP